MRAIRYRSLTHRIGSGVWYDELKLPPQAKVNVAPPVNHSCEPNVAFDMSSKNPADWHVRALRRIQTGEDGEYELEDHGHRQKLSYACPVTFFYPSTEWELDQAFECRCGTPVSDAIYETITELCDTFCV